MKRYYSLFLAFVLGQLLQLMFHAAGLTFFPKAQLMLCAAAGLLFALALFIGAAVANREPQSFEEPKDEILEPPTVIDAHWVHVPEKGVPYDY